LDCEAAGAAAAAWILLATVAAAAAWIVERTLAAVDAAVAAVRSMRLATVVAAVAAALGLVLVLLARRPLVLPPPALQLLSPLFPSQWTVP
jgi:hypothetical protein